MRTVIKTIITTVLLSTVLAHAGNVEARLKYYRYNDNIPMVEMSLNMMVAMGVLEPIPSRLVHDGNPYHRMVTASYSPYSRRYDNYRFYDDLDGPISPYRDHYDTYYGDRYRGDRYGYSNDYPRYRSWGGRRYSPWDSPWADRRSYNDWGNQWDGPWSSPWGSPWDYQRGYSWRNSPWDSPWGNQWNNPLNSYWGNQWNSPWSSGWGSQWGSPWSSSWGSPWGSYWNSQLINPWSSQLGYPQAWPYTSGSSGLPLSPDAIPGNDSAKYKSYPSDDSSRQQPDQDGYKTNKPGYRAEKTSWSTYPSRSSYRRNDYRNGYRNGGNTAYRELNGLWIGENGEMLGIRGHQFLWYDDNNQYSKGQLVRSPTTMKARVDGSRTVVRYHYKLLRNELVIMGRDGKLRSFNRMPLIQLSNVSARPRAAISNYRPERDNVHVSYSSFGPGLKADNTRLYSRNRSDRVGPTADSNRRSALATPHRYYSEKRFAARSTHSPVVVSKTRVNRSWTEESGENRPSSAAAADMDRHLYTGNASIKDSGYRTGKHQQSGPSKHIDARSALPTTTIPMFQKYLPAAARPKTSRVSDPDALPADVDKVKSSIWNSNTAGLDMSDPNTYLYSYLKDSASTPGSTSSRSTENSGQVKSSSSDKDNSQRSVANAGANIWKPNNQFPDQRQHAAQDWSEKTANSAIRKFTWPDSGHWQ